MSEKKTINDNLAISIEFINSNVEYAKKYTDVNVVVEVMRVLD
jgi:hypothetical protein